MVLALETPLEDIPRIQRRFLVKLNKLGLKTVKDLLWHFPFRYEDWREISRIAELRPGDEKTIQGEIIEITLKRTPQKRMFITEALISDETGSIQALWFNQPYIRHSLQKGKMVSLAGKATLYKNRLVLQNPAYEILNTRYGVRGTSHTARIIPIYPETKGLTSKGIRYLIKPILESLEKMPEFLPADMLRELKLPEINIALRQIHLPSSVDEAEQAKKRFSFQDLFLLQLKNAEEKAALQKEQAPLIKYDLEEIKDALKALPFELTDSQKKALWEILQDLSKPHPMNRLLQGDVGSGKTIVAGIAALVSAQTPNNLQAVFMAPTEILARQHFDTLIKFFKDFENGIGLLVAKETKIFYGDGLETKITKTNFLKEVATGKVKILVGTHALIQKGVEFKNLGLVVVDEQHRFGVKQRALLLRGARLMPHFLSMSATPIPRTLTMTIFSNLDLSIIKELPKGRKNIITKIVAPENRDKAYAFIRGQVRRGRQVFVICPRIEKAEDTAWSEVKAVKEEYEKLEKNVFPDLKVAMLHGKLKSEEKAKIMSDLQNKQSDILVTTSVVEVGVDVPNATIMMIEGAERFGLAQLYQFRGRVGRGEHQSFCFLFTDSKAAQTEARLKSLLTAKNGFELAEYDLAIRGPGEFLGEAQTGMPDIALKAIQNPELLKMAQEKTREIIKKDPELKNHPALKEKLNQFEKEIHLE
ncbi:MAG: ATP-dependent DNA helicase RecG [Candidatus Colwellbacteria bacterium]|nr:ATP-dependent DNA helicase RecG [Candidatus Colwellbacteria bacterium]